MDLTEVSLIGRSLEKVLQVDATPVFFSGPEPSVRPNDNKSRAPTTISPEAKSPQGDEPHPTVQDNDSKTPTHPPAINTRPHGQQTRYMEEPKEMTLVNNLLN